MMDAPAEKNRCTFNPKANPLLFAAACLCLGALLGTLIMDKPRSFIGLNFITINNENSIKLLPVLLLPLVAFMFVRLHRSLVLDQLIKLPLVLLAVVVLIIPVNPQFRVSVWWPGADAVVATRSWSDAKTSFKGGMDFFNMRGGSAVKA